MYYVIDKERGYVTHQGDLRSCQQYVANAVSLFGRSGAFQIVRGAKEREQVLKALEKGDA